MGREEIAFRSGEADCAAWLYRPDAGGASTACVVLGHGFGAVKEGRLDAYAQRFRAAGHAALAFDYRHFGASGGEPRQLLDVGRQHQDWRAAIARAPRGELRSYPGEHFDIYVGELFERAVADQVDFLERHL